MCPRARESRLDSFFSPLVYRSTQSSSRFESTLKTDGFCPLAKSQMETLEHMHANVHTIIEV